MGFGGKKKGVLEDRNLVSRKMQNIGGQGGQRGRKVSRETLNNGNKKG